MSLPNIVSRDEWLVARKELLVEEKAFTKRRDALNARRRQLPMVRVDKDYVFTGPDGSAALLDLFSRRHQLVVVHFMFDPTWDAGCSSCSAGADEMSEGLLAHLHARDTSLVYVSRAPIEKIERYQAEKGWTFPWYSSNGSDFNYDFNVTLDESVAPIVYNYRSQEEHVEHGGGFPVSGQPYEGPGRSCFLRQDDVVFHTYSVFARGTESMGGSYYVLDETALGRQEDWEEPKGRVEAARGAVPDFAP